MQKILTSQLEASKIGDLTNAKVNIIEFTSRNESKQRTQRSKNKRTKDNKTKKEKERTQGGCKIKYY